MIVAEHTQGTGHSATDFGRFVIQQGDQHVARILFADLPQPVDGGNADFLVLVAQQLDEVGVLSLCNTFSIFASLLIPLFPSLIYFIAPEKGWVQFQLAPQNRLPATLCHQFGESYAFCTHHCNTTRDNVLKIPAHIIVTCLWVYKNKTHRLCSRL